MSIKEMINEHPQVGDDYNDQLGEAIKHAMYGAAIMNSCADACLALDDDRAECIRRCLDASDACTATRRTLTRHTHTHAHIVAGLIMESPDFPLQPGRYLVTGARSVTTGLTVKADGGWKLDEGTLYDVTHLPCRSARYNPVAGADGGSPAAARLSDFPVKPGAAMPPIAGTRKQDYAVLFVIGKAAPVKKL